MQTVANPTISRKLSPSQAFYFAIPLLATLGCNRMMEGLVRRACLIYSTGASVCSEDPANGDSCSSWRHPWERAVG